jgi:hypothetical protein
MSVKFACLADAFLSLLIIQTEIKFRRRARLTFLWSIRQSKQDFAEPDKMGTIRTMQYWRIGEMRTNHALRVTPAGVWGTRN